MYSHKSNICGRNFQQVKEIEEGFFTGEFIYTETNILFLNLHEYMYIQGTCISWQPLKHMSIGGIQIFNMK